MGNDTSVVNWEIWHYDSIKKGVMCDVLRENLFDMSGEVVVPLMVYSIS